MADVIRQSWEPYGTTGTGGFWQVSQRFTTPSFAYSLHKVELKLNKNLTYPNYPDVSVYLYSAAEDGTPDTKLYTIGTLDTSTLDFTADWVGFSDLNFTLQGDTTYCIVMEVDDLEETYSSQYDIPMVEWVFNSGYFSPPNAQQRAWYGSGSPEVWKRDHLTWNTLSGAFAFRLYAPAVTSFQFWIYDSDYNITATWMSGESAPQVNPKDVYYISWQGNDISDPENPTPFTTSYVETGWGKSSPASKIHSSYQDYYPSTDGEIVDTPDTGLWYFRGKFIEFYTGNPFEYETTVVVGGLSKPVNPTPADEDTEIGFSNFTFSWENGGGAETYDVYVGTTSGDLISVSTAQEATTYISSKEEMLNLIIGEWPTIKRIYWRVDANAEGQDTVTGDEWYFDTIASINAVRLGTGGSFILCTTTRGLYLSSDFGTTWAQNLPDGDATHEWSRGICSSDGSYLVVERKSDSALFRSGNGGSTWGTISPGTAPLDMAMSASGQYVVVVGPGGVYLSLDYGVSWTARPPAGGIWNICSISDGGRTIMVASGGVFYVSFDFGVSWRSSPPPPANPLWGVIGISGDGKIGVLANLSVNNSWFKNSGWNLVSTVSSTPFTSTGQALAGAANAADGATALGLGTTDSPTFSGLTVGSLAGIVKATGGVLSGDAIVKDNNLLCLVMAV